MEAQFTDVDYTQLNAMLSIYTGSIGEEAIKVERWTGTSLVTLLNDLTPNSWNNISVVSYLTGPTSTIRFKGTNETS